MLGVENNGGHVDFHVDVDVENNGDHVDFHVDVSKVVLIMLMLKYMMCEKKGYVRLG